MNSEIFQMIITLFGGLCVFIYGMNMMSDGLQKAVGERMKTILTMITKNTLVAIFAGAIVTAVLQSSSATTVMIIGFVSAGLMTLRQAVSIVIGANIGKIVTAQLIAFDIGDYAWLFVVIGFVMYFFIKKKEIVVNIGETLFGFGLLFVGINIMSNTMEPLAASPAFAELMVSVNDSPIMGAVIGTLVTAVVQSSAAVIAVVQNLASQAGPDGVTSVIGLAGAIPILCGSNIGTTITAALASIGASASAKRTALAHTCFNVVGAIIGLVLLKPYIMLVEFISPHGAELDIISRQIANAHMCFNIITALVFVPCIGLFVKLVETVIKDNGEEQKTPTAPLYLDFNIIDQPVFAIHLACKEITHIAEIALEMVAEAKKAFIEGEADAADKVFELEEVVNSLQGTTSKYLSSMFKIDTVTVYQSKELSGLLHIAGDIEHIGDYCKNIAEFAKDKIEKGYDFSDSAYAEIYESFDQVTRMIKDTIKMFEARDLKLANDILEQEEQVNANEIRLREMHMRRLESGKCSPEFTVIYTDIIHNIEKIGDSCTNIAQIILADFDNRKAGKAI